VHAVGSYCMKTLFLYLKNK